MEKAFTGNQELVALVRAHPDLSFR
jgi:hypothetical protein